MTKQDEGALVRPEISETDAETIARECYGITVSARELGSNQDRNFMLIEDDGTRSVLRIDHPVFTEDAREAQHAALEAYRAAGVPVPAVLPGLNGELTLRWNGFAVRRSEYVDGGTFVELGYLAPVVLEEFGALAASSVQALSALKHPGLARKHMWDMRHAYEETVRLSASIHDEVLRERVLRAAHDAHHAVAPLASSLPVQAIHGDLTDDNVTGCRGSDARVHPHTVLDLGDLSYGWRVAEISVMAASMLHHDLTRPLRVLDAVASYHQHEPLTAAETRALWPLVVLRGALLVASGWHQLDIDAGNDYARARVLAEQGIFDAATAVSLIEASEAVSARVAGDCPSKGQKNAQVPMVGGADVLDSLRSVLPGLEGRITVLDLGVESASLSGGLWQRSDAENLLVREACESLSLRAPKNAAVAAIMPYGVYRLTRTMVDSCEAGATWPSDTEVWVSCVESLEVLSPCAGTVSAVEPSGLTLKIPGWYLRVKGVSPRVAVGDQLWRGTLLAEVLACEQGEHRCVVFGVRRVDALSLSELGGGRARLVTPELVPAWRRLAPDPATLIGLPVLAQGDESAYEVTRRERVFASAQERYYQRPMQIERGYKHYLVDTTGRSYVDLVNNVTGVGHGHPAVADAVNSQIRLLSTNSRFLYRSLAEYSERLLDLFAPGSGLDTVLLVNSGSEAVDLALRLAQAATARQTVISLREAYHGWTMASDAVTTSAYDNPYALATRPEWVRVVDMPHPFRGKYRGEDAGQRYAADLGADLERFSAQGQKVGAFICESVLGNAGGVLLPEGYLADVYARVRAAGGLCIADEVQVGFARLGSTFWGFERSGVIPDIVTIAKSMGNGFPIGGVVTSKKIADSLATQGQFFASTGGNPVSCQAGIAVLDVMREEALQENARVVGARFVAGCEKLAQRHSLIGPIHGEGLYLGVELVRNRQTMEPATQEAAAICERLKELGVITLTTSERQNVLKVKPPLCLTTESVDFALTQLDRVLTEGW